MIEFDSLRGHQCVLEQDGQRFVTLEDILPEQPGLKLLFVAKTPTSKSVEAGHYFQGRQGRMFWNKLREFDVFRATTRFEDDSLLAHEYGITDIAKLPHEFGCEPNTREYVEGAERILGLIRVHRPKILCFVYKRVLDELLRIRFGWSQKARYGFNPDLEPMLPAKVFAFPMPGTPCVKQDADAAMQDLARVLGRTA
ncbi:MAG: hypothetical protein HZA61_11440 [Candidatus Eisenbacteria bacterium]|uniref:Uracil-DNA glycosylase-like domain-containing protein n=1 Tax=Eiseniibacteriota bacterium TaxID=2212470 RepID=A0A933SHP3_UNCEI|nr:hypothetical protein [Candidatus Eisenbacteria bacterium]